jgi:hypothetical protein
LVVLSSEYVTCDEIIRVIAVLVILNERLIKHCSVKVAYISEKFWFPAVCHFEWRVLMTESASCRRPMAGEGPSFGRRIALLELASLLRFFTSPFIGEYTDVVTCTIP